MVATIQQLQREDNRRPFTLVHETLPATEFTSLLERVTREHDMVAALIARNRVATLIPKAVLKLTPQTLSFASIVQPGTRDIDWDAVRTLITAPGTRPLRLSLPAFSEDGQRALVYVWATAGFDLSSGGGYLFEKKQGSWIIVDYLAPWIT